MPPRPNFVFIMADDHSSKAISCYGSGLNRTPNIDRIAKEGIRFNHCYVTNSICTPSRAAILTGTYNHVNAVETLDDKLNKHLPNVAKCLRTDGYQTAMVGKWHLGEGEAHEPSGFDYWSVLPGQGSYFDPEFIEPGDQLPGSRLAGSRRIFEPGYATDIITDKSLAWIDQRDRSRPFFLICHHKAPHRSWESHPRHAGLFPDDGPDIQVPQTYGDDYKNRSRAAAAAKFRVDADLTYFDLGLAQPDGDGPTVGEPVRPGEWERKVPSGPTDPCGVLRLVDRNTGQTFSFSASQHEELRLWKYQRYMRRYLRTVAAVDEGVGRLLDRLDAEPGLAENTVVVYTSDQGFFLGEHGWFDKRYMYEESFQMPLVMRWPAEITAGAAGRVCDDIVCNVDFAATWLDMAGLRIPSFMQGRSFRGLWDDEFLSSSEYGTWPQLAYHRYWMHGDENHDAHAHYGVRNRRYKLIYWYNEGLGRAGARDGKEGEDKEWELFDCEKDPLELFNVYSEAAYAALVKTMTAQLDDKMREIGDEPVH